MAYCTDHPPVRRLLPSEVMLPEPGAPPLATRAGGHVWSFVCPVGGLHGPTAPRIRIFSDQEQQQHAGEKTAKASPSIDEMVKQAIAAETASQIDGSASAAATAAGGCGERNDARLLLAMTTIPAAVHRRMRASRFVAR